MVNVRMVNAPRRCVLCAHFCEIFLDSGRFLRLKNPVKYKSNLRINRDMVPFRWRASVRTKSYAA